MLDMPAKFGVPWIWNCYSPLRFVFTLCLPTGVGEQAVMMKRNPAAVERRRVRQKATKEGR